MIAVGNEKKTINDKDGWNYCHHMPMLSLLGWDHHLPLLHMAKRFIWLNETKKLINEFLIGYIINPDLNDNKPFRDQVEKVMYTTFGKITQPLLKATLSKNNTSVLELIMFFDKRAYSPEKAFKVLSCFIYTIIKNDVCIDYLAWK